MNDNGMPPQFDPEARVVGAVLFEGYVRDDGSAVFEEANVQPLHFRDGKHRQIWAAMAHVAGRREPVTVHTVADRLKESGHLASAGGGAYLSELVSLVSTSASIKSDAEKVRLAHARRVAHEGLLNLAKAAETDEDLGGIIDDVSVLAEDLRDGLSGRKDLARLAITAEELMKLDLPPRASYIGDGILPAGAITLLVGAPGTGKTWLMLQQAIAVAGGFDWLGIPTRQSRVGILELENESRDLQPRIAAIMQAMGLSEEDRRRVLQNIELLTQDQLGARLNLIENWRSVANWIKKRDLNVLQIDSLERTHSGNENEDMPRIVAALESLACDTGAAVVLVHHERKTSGDWRRGSASRADDLNATRGHSVLMATAKVQMRMVDAQGGRLRMLRFGKVNLGRAPEPIYLRPTESGPFAVTEKPLDSKAKGEANRGQVRKALEEAGAAGLTAAEGGEKLGVGPKTFERHAKALGASTSGRPARFQLVGE